MAHSPQSELDYTLEDNLWKDSFDKLLDVRPVLRNLNVLKKDVRASFNLDSSIENSKDFSGLLTIPVKGRKKPQTIRISTPSARSTKQPFKCPISPINDWTLCVMKLTPKRLNVPSRTSLQSTVVNPDIIVIDFDKSKNNNSLVDKQMLKNDDNLKRQILNPSISKKKASTKISYKNDSFASLSPKPRTSGRNTRHNLSKREDTLDNLLLKPRNSEKIKRIQRQVLFDSNVPRRSEKSVDPHQEPQRNIKPDKKRPKRVTEKKGKSSNITIQPGKWRKSLNILMQSRGARSSQRKTVQLASNDDNSVEFVSTCVGVRKTILIKPENIETDFVESFINNQNYQETVLKYCNQSIPAIFDKYYAEEKMQGCYKIGEGVYGEVFIKKEKNELVVCKIIPIEGDLIINGEKQKTYEQILPEIVISKQLSYLRNDNRRGKNITNGFVGVKNVACVKGKYPRHLIKCWESFDSVKESENEHPGIFPDSQLYLVLELEFGGKDLESFEFIDAEQSYAALEQIVFTLAVAEEALQFEHRDLHWGNVLIQFTNESVITYKLAGVEITVPTKGIQTTIIDYTLSRIHCENHCFYNDLAQDEELFTASGDYQFDVYRMMRDTLNNNWQRFEPITNLFWISYIISKLLNGVKYNNKRTKTHAVYSRRMRTLKHEVLEYGSAANFAKYLNSKK